MSKVYTIGLSHRLCQLLRLHMHSCGAQRDDLMYDILLQVLETDSQLKAQ
jgi:hypothetical protein